MHKADSKLVCPSCGQGDRLFSDEEASILYPVTFELRPETEDEPQMEYTGESYEVDDEGTVSRDNIWCKNCTWNGGCASLLTVRQAAHRNVPVGDLYEVAEDSDRGADTRFQGVCFASGNGWSCDFAGLWRHADEYVDEAEQRNESAGQGNAVHFDSAQLAYAAAERDIKEHLHQQGAITREELQDA